MRWTRCPTFLSHSRPTTCLLDASCKWKLTEDSQQPKKKPRKWCVRTWISSRQTSHNLCKAKWTITCWALAQLKLSQSKLKPRINSQKTYLTWILLPNLKSMSQSPWTWWQSWMPFWVESTQNRSLQKSHSLMTRLTLTELSFMGTNQQVFTPQSFTKHILTLSLLSRQLNLNLRQSLKMSWTSTSGKLSSHTQFQTDFSTKTLRFKFLVRRSRWNTCRD